MNISNRIILNTIILYAKILIVMVINLWTVPLLLRALGQSDYGLYQLVAGVIVMLTFINAAMTVSTQRYLSVAMGEKDNKERLNTIYNVSLVLHLCIGMVIVFLLEICAPCLFDGALPFYKGLNIPPERITAAKWIYQFLVVSTFFTIMAVPFDAVLNAHENMAILSLIGILDAVLRLILVLAMPLLTGDLLIIYGAGMAIVAILNVIITYIYTHTHYRLLSINIKSFNGNTFKEMLGFAGWNTFSSFAMTGRNQGIAIIMNHFMGTIVNAAYGIANQINGLLVYFSATIQTSFNPQLMKSEGMKDNDRMLRFAFSLSKMSILALSVLALPLIIEMPYVLALWLKDDVPDNTIVFSRCVLIMSMIYLASTGLMSSIQSHGVVRNYTLTMAAILILNLPIAYFTLWMGYPAYYVILGMIGIEIICLGIRLLFARHLCRLNIGEFIKRIILPTFAIIIITYVSLKAFTWLLPASFLRLCMTCIIDLLIFTPLAYYFVLSDMERQQLIQIVQPVIRLFKK